MPLQNTSGNDTTDAYGGGAAVIPNYIEDVFFTYLYTGTGASLTITNNIDLSTKGGLTWIKSRSDALDHKLTDTARGVTKALISNTSGAQTTDTTGLTAFSTTGFTIGADANYNTSSSTYASWTFRKQPKFFDIQTYTGDGTSGRVLNHSLGSTPGCIIWKLTSSSGESWGVYHRSLGLGGSTGLWLNLTSVGNDLTTRLTAVSSTSVTLGSNSEINGSGKSYVMYFFAHNAGGFGLTGTDNVITCGSYTGNGSTTGPVVTLGYEPQWLLIKKTSASATNWVIADNMRGMPVGAGNPSLVLFPNTTDAEYTSNPLSISPLSTGFQLRGGDSNINASGDTYIYIAIRRGPMKVPTDATKVFAPIANTVSGNNQSVSTGFPVDLIISKLRTLAIADSVFDRLRGSSATSGALLVTSSTGAEGALTTNGMGFDNNTGYVDNFDYWNTGGSYTYGNWAFRRAPSFFDEVCYTGTGPTNLTLNHNLGVIPELAIAKIRSSTGDWQVAVPSATAGYFQVGQSSAPIRLNTTNGNGTEPSYLWSDYASSTTFTTGIFWNAISANTYVLYLFASCPGVSKIGTYTGNGSTQAIACGFTGGARFVLIKRTDSTGDWYVYDTARGMSTLTDPYLRMNLTNAETATLGSVTTTTGGFTVNASILSAINTSSATYIFLAIA